MTKLICQECRHENEPERIYCHNCGARLDRSALAAPKEPVDDSKETRRRLQRMLDPGRIRARQTFFKISKVVLGALALAVVIQMIQAPDLPARTKDLNLPPQINMDMETAAMEHRPAELRYTQEQVNAYLATNLRNKQATLDTVAHFERAVVAFDEGIASMTVERTLFGFPVFTTTKYKAALADGKLVANNKGGAIGRLPVHPTIMEHADFLFAKIWAALERDRKALTKLGGIEFHPQFVVLTPRSQ